MRLPVLLAAAVLVSSGLAGCGRSPIDPPDNGSAAAAAAPPPFATHALRAGGIITSADAAGRPRFIRAVTGPAAAVVAPAAPGSSPETAAREHFARFAAAYGLQGDAVASVAPERTGRSPGGDYLVRMRQQIDGIEVYRGELKVLMRPDLTLMALSGTPSDLAGVKPADRRFLLSPGQALQKALEHLYAAPAPEGAPAPARLAQEPGQPWVWLNVPSGAAITLSEPARAKSIYYRDGERLVGAYYLEFYSSASPRATTSEAYRYLISAADGRVLERHDLTADAAFNYRVFADSTGDRRPFDGPFADYTPHPTGLPDGSDPAFVPPNLVSVESLKTRPPGFVDPWLPATAVQTLGNNVDAYADLFAPDGYSNGDLRATATAPGTFDRVYDTAAEPGASTTQTMAATTNLFYLINWLHDYWYDSGFDEAAGNAQAFNFGRGGSQSDAMRAEAQDSGGLNNANMSTPSDGLAPRMQMYLWSAPERSTLTQVEPTTAEIAHGTAAFGPQSYDLTGQLALAADGTAPPGDACQPIVNDVAGKIALIDRGVCAFAAKAQAAEAAGAIGVIIANNVAGPPPRLGLPNPPVVVNIPAVGITLDSGNALKQLLLGESPVRLHMFRKLDGPGRDGSLDNMIVAHEWGHYFHHRLTDCTTTQCGAMSEGWGDFLALHTALREGDNLDGTFAAGIYGPKSLGDSAYFGIRRFPYSVDFSKNGLTFKHIQNGVPLPSTPSNNRGIPNAEVHNAGEVWCSMLFEAYVALHKNAGERSFAGVRRAFSDYLVMGLQLAPPDATFTETRDAILTAASLLGPGDVSVIADAFARRGAGSCAVSPPREAQDDLVVGAETFSVQPSIAVTDIKLDDGAGSCDSDGTLDGGETGRVQVSVANHGPIAMGATTITLSTTTAGVTFPGGATATLAGIAPFGTQSATLEIALSTTITEVGLLNLTVTVANDSACVTSVAEVRNPRIHADEVKEATATEDAEANAPPWAKTGAGADNVWSRAELVPGSHALHGKDSGSISDTQLVSPPLKVSASGDFQVAFDHAYDFELSDGIYWDGGVIEISTDDGATWLDISTLVNPGYTGVLTGQSGNPMGGRMAYGGQNAAYPASDRVSLNFGPALAGQTVRLRFRIGTDAAVSGPGWTIDNIAVSGIDNKPFTAVVTHAGKCQVPPVARAGRDRTVNSGADVILDGSASSDANGDPLTFLWTQTGGNPVKLLNPNAAVAAFRAPVVSRERTLTFRLTVSDPQGSSSDSVKIKVRPRKHRLHGEPTDDPDTGAGPGLGIGISVRGGGTSGPAAALSR
jgi:hypothetical protein